MPSPILRYFKYEHLTGDLATTSRYFYQLAIQIEEMVPDSAEKSAGLRKLLEAKDCIVRASLPREG